MEKRKWEESEKRKTEERRSEKRKEQERRYRRMKRRRVAKHCLCPMFCGSGGSKSGLTKAVTNCMPCGEMSDDKLHAVEARRTFRTQNVITPHARSALGI